MEENTIEKLNNVVQKIAIEFNKRNIDWRIGGSLMLYLYGIDVSVNDIDILFDAKDSAKIEDAINELGLTLFTKEKTQQFETEYYMYTMFDNIKIDLIGNFKIVHENGIYIYPFHQEIVTTQFTKNVILYLCDISNWRIAYQYMNRDDKVLIIDKYHGGIQNEG